MLHNKKKSHSPHRTGGGVKLGALLLVQPAGPVPQSYLQVGPQLQLLVSVRHTLEEGHAGNQLHVTWAGHVILQVLERLGITCVLKIGVFFGYL